MKLDLDNKEFKIAFDLVSNSNKSFFLTGKAGTGKSTFLKYIVENVDKNIVVVAPTGIAAINANGATIHSFFRFPLRPLVPDDDDIPIFYKGNEKRKIISTMDTLIIDEISMVRSDLLDGIDYSLRNNGGDPKKAFGGKQIVYVGDIFQLEPVVRREEKEVLNEFYKSTYFFDAKVLKNKKITTIELQKTYRQKDKSFINLLDKIRHGEHSQSDLKKINSRVILDSKLNNHDFTITLTTTNDIANKLNSLTLKKIAKSSYTFYADVIDDFDENKYPTESELNLKEGAQVIFLKNDPNGRWVNGTIAKIYKLSEDYIKVKLKNGIIHNVETFVWENIKYTYNIRQKKIEQEILGTFEQYPLKLAWAITINKSQGMTFDKVVIDFGTGTFTGGQTYVALSRVTSFEGLFLKHKIYPTDIYIDGKIREFASSLKIKKTINENIKIDKKLSHYQNHNDLERIGDYYFEKSVTNINNGNFKLAFNELLLGFEYISCDCALYMLVGKHQKSIKKSFEMNYIDCKPFELDFIKAVFNTCLSEYMTFVNLNQGKKLILIKALNSINSFLDKKKNSEVGHYIKGKILALLKKPEEAISELEKALSIKKTQRVHYRLGRYKEQLLKQFGLNHLFQSILLNPSSVCSNRWFKDISDKRGIKLKSDTRKFLTNKFNNSNTHEFLKTINYLLRKGSIKLNNGSTLLASTAFHDFLSGLKSDEKIFRKATENDSGEFDNSLNDDYDYDRDTFDALTDGQYGD
jgi:tetratricopeptide (TPR) repeat protein